MKVITYEYVHQHKTTNGGWTKKQLEVLGVQWPPRNGWIRSVCGKVLTSQEVAAFESGKHELLGNPNKRIEKKKDQSVAVTGPENFVPLCNCDVPPWEDCEHTEHETHQAMLEMLSMK